MQWTPAVLYERVGHHKYQCTVCPFECTVAPGQVGACRVRRGGPDGMQTATFATSVVHVDAIERKPLYHYRPGIAALTLAAPGCSFRCDYCINYAISQFGRTDEAAWSGAPLDAPQIDGLVSRAERLGGCIALSYSEPSLAVELTLALAECAAPRGVELVWKTNGFLTSKAVDLVAPHLAAVNVDVKASDDARHRELTGAPLRPVLDTVEALRAHGVWVEVTTALIPGISDSRRDLRRIAEFLASVDAGLPWHLARFTPAYRRAGDAPTPPAALAAAAALGREAGLRYVYVERALGADGRASWCAGCGARVIERDVWTPARSRLSAGSCPECGTVMEGRWLPNAVSSSISTT